MSNPFKNIIPLTLLCLYACFSQPAYAQSSISDSNEPEIVAIDKGVPGYSRIVAYADSMLILHYRLRDVYSEAFDTSQVDDLFSVRFLSDSLKEGFDSFYNYRIKRLKRDYGLRISGYYNYNFKPGFADEEDVYYRQRAYIGLDWNLLGNSGLFGNQLKAKELKSALQVDQLDRSQQTARDNFLYRYNYLIYVFNSEKLRLIANRLDLLHGLEQIYHELFYVRRVSWEDVLKVKGLESQMKSIQRSYNDYNYQLEHHVSAYDELPAEKDSLPFLDVDPARMMVLYETHSVDSLKDAVYLANIRTKYKSLEGWSVRPFIRYNFQQGVDDSWRKYGSAGVSAAIPLRFGPSSDRLAEAEEMIYEAKEKDRISQRKLDLFNYFYDHQYKKYQLLEFYFKRAQIEERIRKQQAFLRLKSPAFSPVQLLTDIDQKLAVETELVDLKKQMYLDILKIQSVLNDVPVTSFTQPMEMNEYVKRFSGKRSVYIWSNTFCRMDIHTLIADLDMNETREVLLSPGSSCATGKLAAFLNQIKAEGIEVYDLIGNNQLIFDSTEQINQRLQEAVDEGFNGIHLDVEPQALPQWDSLKEEYLARLVDLYSKAHVFADSHNLKFSVSIPVFFPENYLQEIYRNSDQVFLMAYGSNKASTIIRRISEEVAIDPQKTVLAVRPTDFVTRLQMESVIEKVLDSTGVRKVAIHDLKSLHMMDKVQSLGDTSVFKEYSALNNPEGKAIYHLQVAASKYWVDPAEITKELDIKENLIVVHQDGYYKYCIRTFDSLQKGLAVMKEFRKIPRFSGVFLLRTDVEKQTVN
ncbi:hypothetical protein PbJCM13498_27510 [Prolixibacter bellariivorans]|uniref:SPOR domain-containing protein n=1 Tax=Prolixibacter bellariivorans TaxID=314319 RepID=A0A5M4B1R5_9BACT|nr:hypothetical protein [Prolixibacter bellariivorans]GET33888.1 hypothetical protein PbJCM13498_27510 [Prolixibacter bellariivorans]